MTPKPITENTLFYGDNLPILREYLPSESVDLVYLDPPFNSNRSYNVLFRDEIGKDSDAQIEAFGDTWHWNEKTQEAYEALHQDAPAQVGCMIGALREFIGTNQMMAYLVMMAARLVELHRVLKPTGSLYLHCDPTASHYLKIVLDTIFGTENFRNEITWKRSSAHSDTRQGAQHYGRITDTILFYSKGEHVIWNPQYTQYDEAYVERDYRRVDPDGRRYRLSDMSGPGGAAKGNPYYEVMGVWRHWRFAKDKMDELIGQGRVIQTRPGAVPQYKRYLDEMPGIPLQNLWDDIDVINNRSKEMLGYPTQKPLALLERIIQASSNPNDVVLDPFCGCGTAVAAAQKLGRRWIGIDITHLAIALQRYRLESMFPSCKFAVIGEPEDLGAARQLAHDDRYQFQWWALSLVRAKPLGGVEGEKSGKKGSDKGIDGIITFPDVGGKLGRVLVQVKSGHVKSGDIRDLRGVLDREGAAIGVFVTLEEPTKDMLQEAVTSGHYHAAGWNKDYPRIQILTIADLFKGAEVKMPPAYGTFKPAQAEKGPAPEQHSFDLSS
ncbi:MAG TPA: DNA methyltransferase [Tepidisphaeraceae bacterium]|nr:DNA methyltransferase [Tepidisphaeraceae bacterium]